jgi:release factor glutamine methyltransferase
LQNKFSETYAPAEDTFFLAEHIENERGEAALEIGTGSGYLAKILEKNFDFVVATDIDFNSLASQDTNSNRICCDAAGALGGRFDLIVCNLPYLPSEKVVDKTTDGGPEGLEAPLKIIESASSYVKQGGKMLFLTSSLANYQKIIEKIHSLEFSVNIVAKKKLFFEELVMLEVINDKD